MWYVTQIRYAIGTDEPLTSYVRTACIFEREKRLIKNFIDIDMGGMVTWGNITQIRNQIRSGQVQDHITRYTI